MTRKIKLTTAEDLREFMNIAWNSSEDIGVHAPNGQIADAKSILGLISLDYNQAVTVVTEDAKFLKKIDQWTAE